MHCLTSDVFLPDSDSEVASVQDSMVSSGKILQDQFAAQLSEVSKQIQVS